MDQNTIMDALQRALANGTGSLEDLDNLMDRVKADIAKAKSEQEEAARKAAADKAAKEAEYQKRGVFIADLATRLLDEELTDDDVAFVLQTHLKQRGIDAEISGKDIAESIAASNELNKNLKELGDALGELFGAFNAAHKFGSCHDDNKKADRKPETADDVIARFLRSHGL